MKFSKLTEKFEKYIDRAEHGRQINADKLADLQGLLRDKIDRYEARLAEITDTRKKEKLEKRLRVVRAQLQKSTSLQ